MPRNVSLRGVCSHCNVGIAIAKQFTFDSNGPELNFIVINDVISLTEFNIIRQSILTALIQRYNCVHLTVDNVFFFFTNGKLFWYYMYDWWNPKFNWQKAVFHRLRVPLANHHNVLTDLMVLFFIAVRGFWLYIGPFFFVLFFSLILQKENDEGSLVYWHFPLPFYSDLIHMYGR